MTEYHREFGDEGTYVGGGLEDYAYTVVICLKDGDTIHQWRLHRPEVQKLFNDLWSWGFKPSENRTPAA